MKKITIWTMRIILLSCACLILTAADTPAATRTVTKAVDTDDGICSNADCSLREAIDVAAPGDTIVFSALFNTAQTIGLMNGELDVDKDLTIVGPGADLLTIDGNNGATVDNVFDIFANVTVNLSGMTITDGGFYADFSIHNSGSLTIEQCSVSGNVSAGGIRNDGTLTVDSSTISENNGLRGGGIENYGDLTIVKSTVSNNVGDFASALGGGAGGVFSRDGTLTITNSTISGNLKRNAHDNGGGIWTNSPTTITNTTIANNEGNVLSSSDASGIFAVSNLVTIRSTIIAANVNNSTVPDVVAGSGGGFLSGGWNLIGNAGAVTTFNFLGDQTGTAAAPLNPLLDPLGNYGGMTETHRLQTNSPAIDKAYSFGSTEDQRGFTRPFDKANYPNATGGDGSDIGAYELQFAVAVSGAVYHYSGIPIRNARVLIRGANGFRRSVKTDQLGVFRFDNIPRNRTYQVSATHFRLEVVPQFWVIMVAEENINNLNFTALP